MLGLGAHRARLAASDRSRRSSTCCCSFTLVADVVGLVRLRRPAAAGAGARSSASTTSPPSRRCRCSSCSPARSRRGRGRRALARDRRRAARLHPRRRAREPARPLPRRRRADRARLASPAARAASGLLVTAAIVRRGRAGRCRSAHNDLGFLQSWFGKPETRPGQYASSWSQRLIYAYVGGRDLPRPSARSAPAGGASCRRRRSRGTSRTRAGASPTTPRATSRRRQAVHPAADLRPGALRARPRRRRSLLLGAARRAGRACAPGGARARRDALDYVPAAWFAALDRRARRRGAVRRHPADRDASGWSPASRSRSRGPNERADEDRPRDRAAERRRRGAVRARAGRRAAAARTRRARRRRHDPAGRGVDGARRRRARRALSAPAGAAARAARRAPTPPRSGRCAACIRERRPDVLHTHTAKAGATGRIAALLRRACASAGRRAHLPRSRAERLLRARAASAPSGSLERVLACVTDALVAVSDEVRDDLVRMRRRAARASSP